MRRLWAWLVGHGMVLLIAAIALLLPALAVLQYRWTGEITQLEQLRAHNNLSTAAQQLSTQFDAMLAGIYTEFHDRYAEDDRSRSHAPLPAVPGGVRHADLARQVLIVEPQNGGLQVTDAGTGAVIESPPWLDRQVLERSLIDQVPAMVVRSGAATPQRWVVVVLDTDRIVIDVLPALLAGCFEGGTPVEYDVLITRDDEPGRVVFASRPELKAEDFQEWVTMAPLFAIHARDLPPDLSRGLQPDAAAHRWRFFLKGRDGALEAAVGAVRRRNLGVGAGVLGLLALSVALLVASVQRAERGARRQLELVARMSHELRTPLATITCAGENLADALVENATETRHYGEIIQQEGRRLNKTISDILLCCRLQTRADAALDVHPTSLAAVIDRSVADAVTVTGSLATRVEQQVDPRLPPVMADADALRAALKNLVVNAIRHGQGSPVRVSARSLRADGTQVVVDVEDQGPGIPDDELTQVFDSFFRGRQARDGAIEGSGIGLSVVYHVARAHGGQVRASRVHPHGTRLTLHLPALGWSGSAPGASSA